MAWYDFIVDGANTAFDWLQTDTGSAFVHGAAIGAGSYLTEKSRQEHDIDMYNRKMRDKDDRYKASNVTNDKYANHAANLTGGLLTQGRLIKQ